VTALELEKLFEVLQEIVVELLKPENSEQAADMATYLKETLYSTIRREYSELVRPPDRSNQGDAQMLL
jgi:hypothetical protein